MSKYKGKRNYEKEIEETAKRMKKYPESLKSARTSQTWSDFLDSIGVNPNTYESDEGQAFWNKVRNKVRGKEPVEMPVFSERQLVEARAEVAFTVSRDVKGRFTKAQTGTPINVYRDIETGRFISYKKIQNIF